jgi:hypothetical protein
MSLARCGRSARRDGAGVAGKGADVAGSVSESRRVFRRPPLGHRCPYLCFPGFNLVARQPRTRRKAGAAQAFLKAGGGEGVPKTALRPSAVAPPPPLTDNKRTGPDRRSS